VGAGLLAAAGEWPWLAGAALAGGVVGPVLLMVGLSGVPAAHAPSPACADEPLARALSGRTPPALALRVDGGKRR
jgi:hypothetical protein